MLGVNMRWRVSFRRPRVLAEAAPAAQSGQGPRPGEQSAGNEERKQVWPARYWLNTSHPTQKPAWCVLLVLNAQVLHQAMEAERRAVIDMDAESDGTCPALLCLQQHMCTQQVTSGTNSAHAAEPRDVLRNITRCNKLMATMLLHVSEKLAAIQAGLADMQRSLARPTAAAGGRNSAAVLQAYVRTLDLCKAPCASDCFCSCVARKDTMS